MKEEKIGIEETNESTEIIVLEETHDEDTELFDEVSNGETPTISENKPKEATFVCEIIEDRKKNCKVFRMSDGTERAVFYPRTIHAFDEERALFKKIDHSIEEEEGGKYYVSNGCGNSFNAKFSRIKENDELFSIEKGIYRVVVSAKRNSKKRNKGMHLEANKEVTTGIEKIRSLIFKGVHDGSDYVYSVIDNGVKENIVVNEKADIYRYSFLLHQENLTAHYDDISKRINFNSKETGDAVFFIPAPFMTDKNGASSTEVFYEVKKIDNDNMVLNIVADSEWINDEKRAFPVIIDPQIQVSGDSAMSTYSWENGILSSAAIHQIGVTFNNFGTRCTKRMYMSLNIPTIPRNPRIKKAELKFWQASSSGTCYDYPKLGLYAVNSELSTGTCNPSHDSNLIDYAKMSIDHCEDCNVTSYTFDVTTMVDCVYKGEGNVKNLVLKMIDEDSEVGNSIALYGSDYNGDYTPQFIITYESSYGVNTSYRAHTHKLGRFGQGSIDLQCGNLMFESEDFAWLGNRMPVTIKHLYNSALSAYQYTANSAIKLSTANFSAMKVGSGFKLNIMQSMMPATFQHEGVVHTGYVYIGENGEETYFKKSEKEEYNAEDFVYYNLFEDVSDEDKLYDPLKRTLKQGEDIYQFDTMGRLVKITDSAGNHMDITYTSNRITSVTDGAGRDFCFEYRGDFLYLVTAPDETEILYSYSGDLLSMITYPDGKKVSITYTSNKPTAVSLIDQSNNVVYKVEYSFNGDRLASVTEYGSDNSIGAKTTYSYSVASGRTIVVTTEQMDEDEGETANNDIKTVYTFDDEGNIISEYVYSEDTSNTGVEGEQSGIHPYSSDGGAGIVCNINNLLRGHNFESISEWNSMSGNHAELSISNYSSESNSKYGNKVLCMQSPREECSESGVYQTTSILSAGKYTFSTYVRVFSEFSGSHNAGAYIQVKGINGKVLGVSEPISKCDSEYTRLIVPFELTNAQSVQVQILINGKGSVYVDAAQLENNPYANPYNMLENGNFEHGIDSWNCLSGVTYSTEERFNMSKSLKMNGSIEDDCYAYQQPAVHTDRTIRESFTLSGWAKGYGLPNHTREGVPSPTFRLRAVIKYFDRTYSEYGTEEYTANFSPCTEEWQFASVQFSKSKYRTIQYVRIYCDYGFNSGEVYFDDIQLVRDSLESYAYESDFLEGGASMSGDSTGETSDSSIEFDEAKDMFGNTVTETRYADGEFGTLYRAFEFSPGFDDVQNAGNDLVAETDECGYKTTYDVNEETSRNEEVTDRCGNKTAYEYDAAGKTTKVTSKKADGTVISDVSYSYDAFDNMSEIVRGDGMKYVLEYNQFHNLKSIGVEGKTDKLIHYTYKKGNGRLKGITYANGHTMKAIYNSIGQLITEKWFESEEQSQSATATPYAYYKYIYASGGNIVQSIDLTNNKCYNYEYEEGRIIRSTESDIVVSNEIVTSKTVVNTVKYYYNSSGKITKKVITPAAGSAQTIYYETANDDSTIIKFHAGGRCVTSHSKNDSFGRKVFDELQLGTDSISRNFYYQAGEVPNEHRIYEKVKSHATTNLVSHIALSNGTNYYYGYDAEQRITSVIETYMSGETTVRNTTLYTYDALGQLLTETVNGEVVNSMEYDNYGNIIKKNDKVYTYGDSAWKDLLTGFDGKTISYDAQGNPVNYLGHTLSWEKGRQLKRFVKSDGTVIDYTYDANGIRTSKTVGGVKHTYILDSTKILRETWGDNTLAPIYDNEDSVCGILYNEEPYYFIKNLQGDVVSVVNKDAQTVARYSYDAWGACTVTQDTSGCQIATINPFRYRGYYYDVEIGLCYLSSRYYDPEIGRFLNSDDPMYGCIPTNKCTHNVFQYCNNSPVVFADKNGNVASNIIGAVIGGVLGAIGGYVLTNWLANNLGLTGWKRNLFVWGLSALIGATAAAIGYFIGPYVAKVWYALRAKLSGLVRGLFKSIQNITSSKMKHINVSKHLWDEVLGKQTSNVNIKNLIYRAIRNGEWQVLNNGTIGIHWEYAGHLIEITGNVVNGVFKVGNAWVWDGISKLLF